MDDPIPLDELIISSAELGHSKAIAIIRSVMVIVSMISSSVLIWMINRSHARLTTPYHRILLGMSIADILYSFGVGNFNLMVPNDVNYFVWNARGNQASCSAQGFILSVGALSGLLYSCSLNLYSLAVVKYGKSDSDIRTNIEPFLHGVPIAYALSISITLLVKENYNSNGGTCYIPVYDPPHCTGYEDGQIREGFEIPCGRGRDGAVLLTYLSFFITLCVVPLIIGISLGVIYRDVLQQEGKIARYGADAGAFTASTQHSSASDADEGVNRSSWMARLISSTMSSINNMISVGQSSSTSNQNQSSSRAVLNRALAYSIAYFLTWSFTIIGWCFEIANVSWPNSIWYLSNIFNSLQGFFNFLIFVYPKVKGAKSRGGENVTWCQAFATALRSRGIDRTCGRRRGQPPNRTQRAPLEGGRKGQPKIRIFSTRRRAPEAEEEKTEIQAPVETTDDILPEPAEVEDDIPELESPQTANVVQQIEQQESDSKDNDEGFI